jgi:NTP pyrophosphatase (non-canonical NTP hydrolase)
MNMTNEKYQQAIKRTMNTTLTSIERVSMLCMGIAGETVELIDYLKKTYYHDHTLSFDEVKKEIGDILWYIGNICNEFDLNLSAIMQMNIDKLMKRYPNGFDKNRSRNR